MWGVTLRKFEILSIASKEVPFYKSNEYINCAKLHTEDSFLSLPVIDKSILRDNYENFLHPKRLQKKGQFYKTTGTTGIPLSFYWEAGEYIASNFSTWNWRRKYYRIFPADKYCTFHYPITERQSDDTILKNDRIISLERRIFNEETLQKYVNAINDFKPAWILAPMSCLLLLGKFLADTKNRIQSLRYIELNGEYTEHEAYKQISDYFSVPVGELYGSTECNGMAIRCKKGVFHVLSDNVFLETTLQGDVLVTSLTNTYMPLIRYQTGDLGQVKYATCNCAHEGMILLLKRGRKAELIPLPTGGFLDLSIFCSLVTEIQLETESVLSFYVQVNKVDILLVILVKNDSQKFVALYKYHYLLKLKSLLGIGLSVDIKLETNPEVFFNNKTKHKYVSVFEDVV